MEMDEAAKPYAGFMDSRISDYITDFFAGFLKKQNAEKQKRIEYMSTVLNIFSSNYQEITGLLGEPDSATSINRIASCIREALESLPSYEKKALAGPYHKDYISSSSNIAIQRRLGWISLTEAEGPEARYFIGLTGKGKAAVEMLYEFNFYNALSQDKPKSLERRL